MKYCCFVQYLCVSSRHNQTTVVWGTGVWDLCKTLSETKYKTNSLSNCCCYIDLRKPRCNRFTMLTTCVERLCSSKHCTLEGPICIRLDMRGGEKCLPTSYAASKLRKTASKLREAFSSWSISLRSRVRSCQKCSLVCQSCVFSLMHCPQQLRKLWPEGWIYQLFQCFHPHGLHLVFNTKEGKDMDWRIIII